MEKLKQILGSFTVEELQNEVTFASVMIAMWNAIKELKKGDY